MDAMSKLYNVAKATYHRIWDFLDNYILVLIPDSIYLKILYRKRMGKALNLKNPQTYTEKLQWMKIHDRNLLYSTMVDKYEVKKYVADIIGEQYIIPTYGVWDSFDKINFDSLPEQFVLKCTHDSGGIVICTDKATFDKELARNKLMKSLKKNYYLRQREWPYKNVVPRIIAEKYMVDESHAELKDYKFFCFDGKVKALFVASDRMNPNEETKFDFFDEHYNHLPVTNGHPNATKTPRKPKGFEQMKILAEKLSEGFPHLRVDFYDINGEVYFGELTFYHWSGLVRFEPDKYDKYFGDMINLPGID